MNLNTDDFDNWALGGDFNLIRNPDNRNRPGGDPAEMNLFNDLISELDLVEIPFSGRSFTWRNMQADPLLVKLDWVFTSIAPSLQPLSNPSPDPFQITSPLCYK